MTVFLTSLHFLMEIIYFLHILLLGKQIIELRIFVHAITTTKTSTILKIVVNGSKTENILV